jgi:hypothetical protein
VSGESGIDVGSAMIRAERSPLLGQLSGMAAPLGVADGNVLARQRHWPALILVR